MGGHRVRSPFASAVVNVRLLALMSATVALSGLATMPSANASGGKARHGAWASTFSGQSGPVWNHNHGRHNQNAPAIDSPTTVTGVQQVSNLSGSKTTQSGLCTADARICKASQRLFFSRGR